LSDVQRSRPPRRDFRRGGSNRSGGGFRRERPTSNGPGIDYRAEKPDEVSVEAFERGGGTVAIKVKLADEDIGRFIGKAGRNIEAIRTLVRVASLRDRKRVFVDLATPSLSATNFAPRGGRRSGGEVTA